MHYFPGIHWIGDWEGFRIVLNIVAKRKFLAYFWDSKPRLSFEYVVHSCASVSIVYVLK